MENANILLIEDDDDTRTVVKRRLERKGHHVTSEAATREQAFKAIADIYAQEVNCDLIITDRNLSRGDERGHDAQVIYEEVQRRGIDVGFIVFSGQVGIDNEVDLRADAVIIKPDVSGLVDAITHL
jgi:DNA-binding NtrC family response regulator